MVSTHAMRQWSVSQTQISTTIDGETVVLNTASGRYFSLDRVGSELWQMLQQTHTEEELVTMISSCYDVETETAARDVHALLGALQEAGLACS